MAERLSGSLRYLLAAGVLVFVLAFLVALSLISRGDYVTGLIVAAVGWFGFRAYWSVTKRKRELVQRGYTAGRRVGTAWVYEELHHGEILGIELPLEYAGRGEYDIRVPGEKTWRNTMPAWARDRREEIVGRLGTVFKHSQMHVDPDPPDA